MAVVEVYSSATLRPDRDLWYRGFITWELYRASGRDGQVFVKKLISMVVWWR